MHSSAGPDLPHTHTLPRHWIATLAALAAVVGAAALVQPSDATASPLLTAASAPSGSGGPTVGGPDPDKAWYPLDCAGEAVDTVSEESADLDRDGRAETAVVVRCHAGIGTPPSGIYVLAHPADRGGEPRIVATLLDPKEGLNVMDFAVRDRIIAATLLGYSSPEVPRCCPDRQRKVVWRWRDGRFMLNARPVAKRV